METNATKVVCSVSTLFVYSDHPLNDVEKGFFQALRNVFESFSNMKKENNFCMRIGKNTYLLGNNTKSRKPNPFVFLSCKQNVSFHADISYFANSLNEFQEYIDYYNRKHGTELSEDQTIQLAMRDYRNDKLDFCSNSQLVSQDL